MKTTVCTHISWIHNFLWTDFQNPLSHNISTPEITFSPQSFEQGTLFTTEESGPFQDYRRPGDLGTISAIKEQQRGPLRDSPHDWSKTL
jgi:hypothetical protein